MVWNSFISSFKAGVRQLASRPLYLVCMIAIPIASSLFLLNLMSDGLPKRVPAAIVDLDNSTISREIDQMLDVMEMVEIGHHYSSYYEAMQGILRGDIYGFYMIPENFAEDLLGGRNPEISYFTNQTYYVPASLLYKQFKSASILTAASISKSSLTSKGATDAAAMAMIQPIRVNTHPLGNPWLSYSIYLGNSFIPAILALMILLVTVFSIGSEIKYGTSIKWLSNANDSILMAVIGKLLPQTIIFSLVGIFIQTIMYRYLHFPMNGSYFAIFSAMVLLVIASQALALFVISVLPNLRLALSMASLIGVLSFSVAGFSFPVESMYGSIAIFSYILPIRYYFLIYIDQALNGIELFYSRLYYIALLIFPLLSMSMLWRLKRACKDPLNIP